jgi:hypothetical protein
MNFTGASLDVGSNPTAPKSLTQGGYMSIAGVNLEGKTVLIRKTFFKPEYANGDRRFKCESGFGCDPSGSGTKVYGTFLSDGEETWVRRSDIESVEAK